MLLLLCFIKFTFLRATHSHSKLFQESLASLLHGRHWHCSPQQYDKQYKYKVDVSKNSGTPKSSILMGFSIINHPFWDTSIFGNTQVYEDVLGIRIQDPVAHHNTFGTWTSCSSSPLNHCVQQWEGSRPAKSSKVVASPSHALSPVVSRGPSVHLLY